MFVPREFPLLEVLVDVMDTDPIDRATRIFEQTRRSRDDDFCQQIEFWQDEVFILPGNREVNLGETNR